MEPNISKENRVIRFETKGVSKDGISEINKCIKDWRDTKVIIICDYKKNPDSEMINNLDILKYIYSMDKLVILNHSSVPLDHIDNTDLINNLTEFYLGGTIYKEIDLGFLERFKLNHLDLEIDATTQIYQLLNKSSNLKSLSINTLDAQKLKVNNHITQLKIYRELLNPELLAEKYPNLETIKLVKVKKINDFSFLSNFHSLKNISLNATNIISFPKLAVNKLDRLELLANKKIENASSILFLDYLNKIAITYSNIDANLLIKYCDARGLEQFYLASNKKKDQDRVLEYIRSKGIDESYRGFWE